MNSEENTIKLIEMLDDAVNEIEKIDDRLKDYEEKISAVGDAVRIVGERDNVIQLQQSNQHALLDLLEGMMSSLEFSKDSRSRLMECDLSSQAQINRCTKSANELNKLKAHELAVKTLSDIRSPLIQANGLMELGESLVGAPQQPLYGPTASLQNGPGAGRGLPGNLR